VLDLAPRCGVLKLGDLTVVIDGTKVLANASKHTVVSYGRASEQLQQVNLKIAQLMAKADAEDNRPLHHAERTDPPARPQREALTGPCRHGSAPSPAPKRNVPRPAMHPPKPPPPASPPREPKAQIYFTDPDSRIMKSGSGAHFEQAATRKQPEVNTQLIVG
jgi:hypothetical protein